MMTLAKDGCNPLTYAVGRCLEWNPEKDENPTVPSRTDLLGWTSQFGGFDAREKFGGFCGGRRSGRAAARRRAAALRRPGRLRPHRAEAARPAPALDLAERGRGARRRDA